MTSANPAPAMNRAWSPATLLASLAASSVVGYCDIISGELRLTTFYLAIIFGTTWLANRTYGFLMALVDLVWVIWANPPSSLIDLHGLYYLIENLGTAVIFFASVILADRLRTSIDNERLQNTNLSRYLPAEVADLLAREGMGVMRPQRLNAAILFMDIRDFTASVQTMAPDDLFSFLQEYRTLISRIIEEEGGIIDKFIGDGVLAVFGTVRPSPTDAVAAIRCARWLVTAIDTWNVDRGRNGKPKVRVGIGIHYGEIVVGAIGDEHRLEYTVLGHAVNVASRIERLTKKYALPLLVSDETLAVAAESGTSFANWRHIVDEEVPGVSGALHLAYPGPSAASDSDAVHLH
jgi:class 3 adenylate cyclase